MAWSSNKAFAAAGGAPVLPSGGLLTRIRRCGAPMLFSGPIQPPMLAAAVASARLHLSSTLPVLQAELHERIRATTQATARLQVPLVASPTTPIVQTQCDSPRTVYAIAQQLRSRGFYCCICVFPAVPMNRPGIRFTISRHNGLADIEAFIAALAESLAAVGHLAFEGAAQ